MLLGVLSMPATTYAVSSNQTTRDLLITTIQNRINDLKAQLDKLTALLQSLQSQSSTSEQDTEDLIEILNDLRPGMKNNDVKKLQELLATDPSIYPSGLVTGYYGTLTENAVKKLQNKLCLQENGSVNGQTLSRINELLTEGAGSSGKIPPGLLRAPGIQKKLCTGGGDTTDTTAPVISNITETNITVSGAQINWNTNEAANSKIWYSTTTPVSTTGDPTVVSSAYVTSHALSLTGLTANTTYYYVIGSADASNNLTKATEGSFTTLVADTTAPVISNITETNITVSGAQINWNTNEAANSKIWYSTTTPVSTTGDPTVVSSAYVTSHALSLTGLTANTTYYYVIGSADASNNLTKATEDSFATLSQ